MTNFTLFVGEGNFSFSASYIQNLEYSKCNEQVVATALITRCLNTEEKSNIQFIEDHGGTVYTNVDATKLEHHPVIARYLFSKIYFYFPHVPKKMNIKENRKLVEHFFISAKYSKMREVRTSMIDLQFDTNTLTDPEKRSSIVKSVEDILQSHFVQRKCEAAFGESYVVNFSNEDGSLTCTFKSYPFGLVTLTFEDCLDGDAAFTNPKLEDIRKELHRHFKVKVEKIPIIKRGSAVPLYFTTADERILEYDFNKVVFQDESPYQNIKILHSPTLGNCLILDDLQNLAESDINYTHGVMKYGSISYTGKEVLILGGGDGGLLHELLKENPKFVTMVDIDQMVVDACRIHLRGCCGDSLDNLEGPNYKVIIDDCLKKLDEYKETGRKFDVIINDLTDIPIATSPQGEMWEFVKKIINKSLVVLRDDGSYLNHALGEGCIEALKTYESMLSTLPEKVTFQRHSAYVPSFMENWVFYEIKKV